MSHLKFVGRISSHRRVIGTGSCGRKKMNSDVLCVILFIIIFIVTCCICSSNCILSYTLCAVFQEQVGTFGQPATGVQAHARVVVCGPIFFHDRHHKFCNGGASVEGAEHSRTLESAQKRGRWQSAKSVRRHEKSRRLIQTWSELHGHASPTPPRLLRLQCLIFSARAPLCNVFS